ncbi:hypothetical protein JCM10212_006679 [Sporobolomyces blumeae]
MSFYDRFRAPGGDLASFFRSLTTPSRRYASDEREPSAYEWELLRARQGGTKRLDFFDADLVGPNGATVVLQELERSPGATSIALSQNRLGDDGVRELLVGMKRLRAKDVGARLQEINLSGCGVSDVGFYLIALHLLQSSPHPPSITHLYLTANNLSFRLSGLAEFLGKSLSSSTSSVRCLSLTNNPSIGTAGVVALLPHLRLGTGPSQLSQLHLSVCGLTPDCAEPLARWLEDPEGGSRLQVLAVNGCNLGEAGLRRIARAVTSGKASSLIHLEFLANEDAEPDRWVDVVGALEAQESDEDKDRWKLKLEAAKERNKQVYKETRLAALSLVAPARVLFGGGAREPTFDAADVMDTVENMRDPDNISHETPGAPTSSFPFLRLPIEIRVHVLRCLLFLRPSRLAAQYPPADSSERQPGSVDATSRDTLSSPLTESQFLRVLAHCADRRTLAVERRIFYAAQGGHVPSLNPDRGKPAWARQHDGGTSGGSEEGWEEWLLRSTGCDRFERAGRL